MDWKKFWKRLWCGREVVVQARHGMCGSVTGCGKTFNQAVDSLHMKASLRGLVVDWPTLRIVSER